ncbi:unknown [Diachasmimorpha longicaudata entomopoxvirus]|uniref:Uncharacterized protein n=1 Tax=Diachasmimorpha longicaudata entomopoxvirus TaxID=109981 RepID=Q8B5Y2_9POXV|nr:hypothetical protein FLA14_p206 [Diachasmimorpha longicaudata entomopoxvirus]AAN88023.1 unknown [Diachasmimorpha longicaudata entomopoxvirus]
MIYLGFRAFLTLSTILFNIFIINIKSLIRRSTAFSFFGFYRLGWGFWGFGFWGFWGFWRSPRPSISTITGTTSNQSQFFHFFESTLFIRLQSNTSNIKTPFHTIKASIYRKFSASNLIPF